MEIKHTQRDTQILYDTMIHELYERMIKFNIHGFSHEYYDQYDHTFYTHVIDKLAS